MHGSPSSTEHSTDLHCFSVTILPSPILLQGSEEVNALEVRVIWIAQASFGRCFLAVGGSLCVQLFETSSRISRRWGEMVWILALQAVSLTCCVRDSARAIWRRVSAGHFTYER